MNPILAGVFSSLFFVSLNVAMNIYTKWLFSPFGGNFALPWTMLSVQQLENMMLLQPVLWWMRRKNWDKIGVDENAEKIEVEFLHYFQVFVVTLLFCVNVGLNSLSLVEISITLNQTVRAFLPIGVLVLASCLEGRAYPKHSYFTTLILVAGILITCWGSPDFKLYGFSLAFSSTVVAAGGTSLTGRLLSKGPFARSGPYGIANLLFIQSIPAFFIFSAIAICTEYNKVMVKILDLDYPGTHHSLFCYIVLVSASSFLALLANLGRCFLVAATSALMETLAGNAKVAVLCVLDHWFFGTVLHLHNYIGITLTFVGFSVHVLLQAATPPEERQNEDGSGDLESEDEDKVPEMPAKTRAVSTVPRARLVSGLETGLAAEELAGIVRNLDTKKTLPRKEVERPRANTWPEQGPDQRHPNNMFLGVRVDPSLIFQAPGWLTDFDKDYSPVGPHRGITPSARASLPAGKRSPVANAGRSRFYTDPTDRGKNNTSRLLQNVRDIPQVAAVEEEQAEDELSEGPDFL